MTQFKNKDSSHIESEKPADAGPRAGTPPAAGATLPVDSPGGLGDRLALLLWIIVFVALTLMLLLDPLLGLFIR